MLAAAWLLPMALLTTSRWQDVWITDRKVTGDTSMIVREAVRNSEVVLMLPGIASAAECSALVDAACEIATRASASSKPFTHGRVRLPCIAATQRAQAQGKPCPDVALTHEADALVQAMLTRCLDVIDEQLPSLRLLFGHGKGSLASMYAANALLWADREPAVNVYKEGGEFLPHKDGQALTVLIPLTTSDAFKGGGTGFWRADTNALQPRGPPTVSLAPPAGTALLWGGRLTHAGLPVEDGTRAVLVASFSPRSGYEEGDFDFESTTTFES
jgi:hypothetical protein